jgi:hypothetical protein
LLDEIAGDGADALANQTRATLAMGLIVKDAVPLTPGAPVVPTPVNDTIRRALRFERRQRAPKR